MDKIRKIQQEIGKMQKDQKVEFGKTKYKFFNIEQLLDKLNPLLDKYHLMIVQPLDNVEGGRPALTTAVMDLVDGDEKIVIKKTIPLPDIQDPQKMGSAITYYRRYALQSLFMLQTEDDDGRSAKVDPIQEQLDEETEPLAF